MLQHFRKPYPKVPWGPRPQFAVEPTVNGQSSQQISGNVEAQKNGVVGGAAGGDPFTSVSYLFV